MIFASASIVAFLLSLECCAIDPCIVATIIDIESGGDPNAVSPAGAVGLMQVMPAEAGFYDRPGRLDLFDEVTNLEWGCRILDEYLVLFDDDIRQALAAYNLGPTGLENAGGANGEKAQRYLKRFEESWKRNFEGRPLPWVTEPPARLGGPKE